MRNLIFSDLYRYGKLSGIKGLLRGLLIPGFRYTLLLRLAAGYKENSVRRFILRVILRKYVFKYGIQIPVNTQIGKGLYIGHFGNIVVSANATLGENCNIAHSVTIGQTRTGKRKGAPRIGNYVWIGTGSVIVGSIDIGSNVLIAPLSFVNFDVPDNSLVIGNPAKIIYRTNATEGHINNIL